MQIIHKAEGSLPMPHDSNEVTGENVLRVERGKLNVNDNKNLNKL